MPVRRTPRPGAEREHRPTQRSQLGISLVELLIVITVVGVIAAISVSRLTAPDARLFANDLKATLEVARYEAVKRNIPIAVTWTAGEFRVRAQADASLAITEVCSSASVLHVRTPTTYRGITLSGSLLSGVVWLPSGLVRTCTGDDLASAAVAAIADGRSTRQLELSPAGAVTLR